MALPEDQSGRHGAALTGSGRAAFGGPADGYARVSGHVGDRQAPDDGLSSYWRDQQLHAWQLRSAQDGGRPQAPVEAEPEERSLIRPYAMTGGRTRPRYQLAIETLVSTATARERIGSLLPEHQQICSLCTDVKSVAEISALLSIPLGVARILVADLAESGLVAIHQPAAAGDAGGTPDVTLLERVLIGLRRL